MEDIRFVARVLLEPLALVTWALLALNLLLWRQRAAASARWLCALATLFLAASACPFLANGVLALLERRAAAQADCARLPAGSVFIVLAGGIDRAAGNTEDIGHLSEDSYRRTISGVHLAEPVPDSRLVVSGGYGGHVREADLMRTLAQALGMPAGRITEDRDSHTTYGNAQQVKLLLAELPGRPAYLVTSAMHMPRALATFRSAGLQVRACPVDFRHAEPEGLDAIVPRVDALLKTSDAVREILAYLVYSIQGRIDAGAAAQQRA